MRIRPTPSQRIFLVCLALAAAAWLLVKLSKSYTVTMPLTVRFKNLPRGLYIDSGNAVQLPARIRVGGYRLLTFNWFVKPVVVIDAQRAFKRHNATYYWLPARDKSLINAAVKGYEVLSLPADSLRYPIEKTVQKYLPIRLPTPIAFADGYDGVGQLHMVPDSVLVTAPNAILDSLHFIYTLPYGFQGVKRTIEDTLGLVNPHPAKLRMAVTKVTISWEVDRFTEGDFTLPISVGTLASGDKLKLFPPRVKLRFRVPLGRYARIQQADFRVAVDTSRLSENPPYLSLKLVSSPDGVKGVRITPTQVEYLIIGR